MRKSHFLRISFICMAFLAGSGIAFGSGTVVLNHPDFPFFHATALDQPRLYGLLIDGGEVIQDANGPVMFRAFVDTGSSGFVLSNLHAEANEHEVGSFGFTESDYIGDYTNLGIGGSETGSVSRPFGVVLHNDPFPAEGFAEVADFDPYGEHRLWVRKAPGIGEVIVVPIPISEDINDDYQLVSPINIVGMPVIEQRTMVMTWQPIPEELRGLLPDLSEHVKEMRTQLLPHGDSAIPATNITLDLEMRDFIGEVEILPSMSRNPLVKNVTISHDPARESITAHWLFDTGAGSSFVGFTWAKQIGLIPDSYDDLETFVEDHIANDGMVSQIGGIGDATVTVPVMTLNEIRVPAREGFDIVWENVRVMVFDHAELAELELEGIFGMNLIGPAATIDSRVLDGGALGDEATSLAALLGLLSDVTPAPFDSIIFKVTGDETAELRLFSDRAPFEPPSFAAWRENYFGFDADNPEISGPDADPDHTGIPNLFKYAFGLQPGTSSRDNLPEPKLEEFEDEIYLTLTYLRIKHATDLAFVVEASDHLINWSPDETIIKDVLDLGSLERVTVRDTQPRDTTASRFLRLRVTLLENPE